MTSRLACDARLSFTDPGKRAIISTRQAMSQTRKTNDGDDRLNALTANAAAITSLALAVEGTLGPRGLDCMLVDRFGDVTVTNDGATILDRIDTNHPAARMLIRAARAQEEKIGDGTTTTALLACQLIADGAAHAAKGVPVTRLIEGIRLGIAEAAAFIESHAEPVSSLDDPILRHVALVSARGHADIADLMIGAAKLIGRAKLLDPGFVLADSVIAKEGAASGVIAGIILDKQRASKQMPKYVDRPTVLIVDDALEPPEISGEALATESGFARHMAQQEEFRADMERLVSTGVKFVAVAKGIDAVAEEILTDAGVLALRRLSSTDIARLVELTGAHAIKRSGLHKTKAELESFLGKCDRVYEDDTLDHVAVLAGRGKHVASIIITASTREVKEERERIARDAAGAVQEAVKSGVIAGGGAIEIAAARHVLSQRHNARGMEAYGIDAVASALRRIPGQIAANAGFNQLEKVEAAAEAQIEAGSASLGVDCDTGEIADMLRLGIVDPVGVKLYAIRTAAEVAEAILRISVVIRKREEAPSPESAPAQ
jgi:chaperonin GroEL (HSP60 family)